jgi:hypothetical protein
VVSLGLAREHLQGTIRPEFAGARLSGSTLEQAEHVGAKQRAVSIRVDRRAFRFLRDDDASSWTESIVVDSDAQVRVLDALRDAAVRIERVSRGGREYDLGALDILDDRVDVTKHAVVSLREDGLPALYVDCQGDIGLRRSTTLRRIVREELARHGVRDAYVKPSPDHLADDVSAVNDDDVPPWVRFRDQNPVGFPEALRPEIGTILSAGAGLGWFLNAIGERHDGSWCAQVGGVDLRDPAALVDEIVRGLVESGCTPRLGPSVVRRLDYVAAATYDGLDVVVLAYSLRGRPDKPLFLGRRKEPTFAGVAITQRDPSVGTTEAW